MTDRMPSASEVAMCRAGPLMPLGGPHPTSSLPADPPGSQIGLQAVTATDLRGRLRAQGFAWDHCEVIATVVDEWLTDSSEDTVDSVADIDNWQRT